MDSMKSRLITAAIFLPIIVVVFIFGEFFHWIMYLLISGLCALMSYELLSAKKLHKNLKVLIPCGLYAIAQPLLIAADAGLLPTYVFVVLMFFIMILDNDNITFGDLSLSLIGTVLITGGMSSILVLPHFYKAYFTYFFVLAIGVPWFADAGAYFAGVFLGKHKLCPRISPKKTVEGFIGGIIIGSLSSLFITIVFMFIFRGLKFDFLTVLLVGVAVSVVSVLGDLSFSLIKRHCGIKDYGSVFPGHGGFLDRFDSVIFSAPIICLAGVYFPLFTIVKV